MQMSDSKIGVVRDWSVPTNRNELQKFLGFINVYRRFIPHFADKARSLYDLLKINVPWQWTVEQQNSFEFVKYILCSQVVLAFPDLSKEFHVTTDANPGGVGACLWQYDENGLERPIE